MDLLINAGNILSVLAHFTMDMLRLRLLSVAAACCLATYFYARPEPLMNVVAWNLFFVLLNLVQVARIVRSRWAGHAAGAP